MHIDVDSRRIDLHINIVRRQRLGLYQIFVDRHHRTMKIRMLHEPIVDEKELILAAFPGQFGRTDVALYSDHRRLGLDGQQLLLAFKAGVGYHPLFQIARRIFVDNIAILDKRHGNVRMSQRHAQEFGDDAAHFGRIRLQETSARRHVKKQVLDQKLAADGRLNQRLISDLRSRNAKLDAQFLILLPRQELDLSHRRNRRQRLATEAHAAQSIQIGRVGDFRCRVTLECHSGIIL